MGFHPLDILVIVGIALLIFGPKTLQSISHNAGKGVAQAKEMKDKLMADLPIEEISKINKTLSQIPTSPQQVAHKLVSNALKTDEEPAEAAQDAETTPAELPTALSHE